MIRADLNITIDLRPRDASARPVVWSMVTHRYLTMPGLRIVLTTIRCGEPLQSGSPLIH